MQNETKDALAEYVRGRRGKTAHGEWRHMLLTAGDVGQVAFFGRHPEVGGARVEDDAELLRWRADADWPVILCLERHSMQPQFSTQNAIQVSIPLQTAGTDTEQVRSIWQTNDENINLKLDSYGADASRIAFKKVSAATKDGVVNVHGIYLIAPRITSTKKMSKQMHGISHER